jgi:hypothetical protein
LTNIEYKKLCDQELVTHAFIYLEDQRSGELWFHVTLGKNVPFQQKKSWAQWSTPVIPAREGSINKRIVVQASLGKKRDPVFKITRAERGWRHGSSSRVPAFKESKH